MTFFPLKMDDQKNSQLKSSYFHLVLPGPSDGLCKTLFSAAALNYPTPRIVSYGQTQGDSVTLHNETLLAKLEGVLDFLQQLGDAHRQELVYIPDGLDTSFQLRPEVLIKRYNAVRKRLEIQSRLRYGVEYDMPIVFSTQKHCEATDDSFACNLVSTSSLLRADVGEQLPARRHLSTGSMIGEAGAVRTLFEHAKWKAEQRKYPNDQEIFAEIFGHQEYYREATFANQSSNERSASVDEKHDGNIRISTNTLHPCGNCQFGMALDYLAEISLVTSDVKTDLMSSNPSKTPSGRLPQDIHDSTPPFWSPDYSGTSQLPDKGWWDVSLLKDKRTGIHPVAIHKKAKANVSFEWEQPWYASHFRVLVTAHAKSMRIPFAVVRDQGNEVHEYWGFNDGFGGARVHELKSLPGRWRQWDELCGTEDTGNRVFPDGNGAYESPVYYLPWDASKQQDQLERWQSLQDGKTSGRL
ncbi:hypothetical protein Q7P37_009764 [Cladosporium fusiforme]